MNFIGAFGKVYKAQHKLSSAVRCVKKISKQDLSEDEAQKLQEEVAVLRKLDHPNIVKVLEFYQNNKYFFIVTEFLSGGELFDRIMDCEFFSEHSAAIVMQQLLSAVVYLHSQGFIHR